MDETIAELEIVGYWPGKQVWAPRLWEFVPQRASHSFRCLTAPRKNRNLPRLTAKKYPVQRLYGG
jgi:hypothetical protein